jgi:cyclic beta-1,2-glucan synthetase
VKLALESCVERLYDPAHGITKLFWPPFGDEGPDPGYIRACGPGFRENGGQYTHGAVWLASALLRQGMTEQGAAILLDLLPSHHDAAQYGAEPYVLAADVSANDDHYGQALWSWYTGSSGWFFRVVLEDLLGIRLVDGKLTVEPHLPQGWDGYEAHIGGKTITVKYGRVTIQ